MHRTWFLRATKRTFHDAVKRFKVKGVHPDMLMAVDSAKAHHNGEELVKLEELMAKRSAISSGPTVRADLQGSHLLEFWISPQHDVQKRGEAAASSAASRKPETIVVEDNRDAASKLFSEADGCRRITCELTPLASDKVVKEQLEALFRSAGMADDFDLPARGSGTQRGITDLKQAVDSASRNATESFAQSGALYSKGEQLQKNFAQQGTMIVFETDTGQQLLATMPADAVPRGAQMGTSTQAGMVPPEVRDYMDLLGVAPFDFRVAGSPSAVERLVTAFDRLWRIYDINRGVALRPNVCLKLTIKPDAVCTVTPDGVAVLPLQAQERWAEYLMGLSQDTWRKMVNSHTEWRVGGYPKFEAQQRQLKRLADALGFFRIRFDTTIGEMLDGWQATLVAKLLKDEPAIRKTIQKHNLGSKTVKRMCEMIIAKTLDSASMPGETIDYRVTCDGKLYIAAHLSSTQIVRILRDHLRTIEQRRNAYDKATAQLEFIQRSVPIDFSVDTDWRRSDDANAIACIVRFSRTIAENKQQLASLTKQMGMHMGNPNDPKSGRRMHWIISSRFEAMPNGDLYVPWDVDMQSIEQLLIGGGVGSASASHSARKK